MLKLSTPNIGTEEIDSVIDVLKSGNLVQGEKVAQFENELATFTGANHSRAVSSGTAALYIALLALEIGPGHAVVVPGFTFPATANAVAMTGAVPVIADVCPESYCISLESINTAIDNWQGTEKISAIIPVHEFGHPADMPAIMKFARANELFVIEDAACAIGATIDGKHVGTFGDIGCFSFHPRKTLTTGEGGALTFNNQNLDSRIQQLRNHGINKTSKGITFSSVGLNFRLTDIQAAIGIIQLKKTSSAIRHRRTLALHYESQLRDVDFITLPNGTPGHSWQTYMLLVDDKKVDRNQLITQLIDSNVETNLGAQSLLKLPSFSQYSASNVQTPISDQLYRQGLALPFCELYRPEELTMATIALKNSLHN